MKKVIALVLALVMGMMLFGGCNRDPGFESGTPTNGDEDPKGVGDPEEVEIQWITEPSLRYADISAMNYYYDLERPEYSRYLIYRTDKKWGLLDNDLNVVISPFSDEEPFFCMAGELHFTASQATVDNLTINADDIVLTSGGHGGSVFEYIYDTDTQTMYILFGDVGEDLFTLDQYPYEIPDIVPVALVRVTEEDPYNWGPTVTWTDRYGFCDNTGRLISTKEYEYADTFYGGLAAVRYGNLWGYVDFELNEVVPNQYRGCTGTYSFNDGTFETGFHAFRFLNGYAVVRAQDGKYGVIDTAGKTVIPCEYSKIVPVYGGRVAICDGSLWGLAELG